MQGMDARLVLDAPGGSTAAAGDATAIWVSGSTIPCPEGKEDPCHSYVVQAAGYDPDGLPEVELEAPLKGLVGEEVEVTALAAGLYSPTIDFGDGEEVAAAAAAHVYDAPGDYELTGAAAEELGYRVSAQSTIKILPVGSGGGGDPEEEAGEEAEGAPGETGGTGSGDSPGAGAGASSNPPATAPNPAPAPRAEAACAAARAAQSQAAEALTRARRRLASAAGAKAHRRLSAAKRRRSAALQRAKAGVEADC